MHLESESPHKKEAMSAPRAEIISRLWQAVSFLEELRTDLVRQLRQTGARDHALAAVQTASTHLTLAGGMLALPTKLPRTLRSTMGRTAPKAATG